MAKKILSRQRELGMTPVLQGFTGHVPPAIAQPFPEAKLHHIRWIEWETALLDPLDPLFPRVAQMYLEEQSKRFGTDHLYAADTFIEMQPPSKEPSYLANLAKAIYNGMTASDPQAVWVLQGWIFFNNPDFWKPPQTRAMLGAVPDDRMIALDLFCEQAPTWLKTEAFYGKPWLWCNIQNFGGTVHLSGALSKIGKDLPSLRYQCQSGKLAGLGFVNEGLGYNPVVYDLMFEMAWRDQSVDLKDWIDEYAVYRYGRKNEGARSAWQILLDSAYNGVHGPSSVINQAPQVQTAASPPYDNARLAEAWKALLQAADDLGSVDTFRFDLVNVARQVLSNHAATLQGELVKAAKEKDAKMFDESSRQFLDLIRDLDELLATRREFLLGGWLEDAKRWGTIDAERARFEWNARRVLTQWGQTGALDDYARKEWAGMLGDYYLRRWLWFLHEVGDSIKSGKPFDDKAFRDKLREWTAAWSDHTETYPTEPHGDSIEVAKRMWTTYGTKIAPARSAQAVGTSMELAGTK
jgi:alpha-N-acetylglucosaminidase